MFGKLIATWLLILTLSPFTAPFATCDLAVFFTEGALAPVPGTSQDASLGDASHSPALLLCRPSGRVRFIALSQSRLAADGVRLPAAGFARSLAPVRASSPQVSFSVLRI
jgi:hypothetical protein